MNLRSKVDGQPAYVLHAYPFRETSLIVEVFSRDFGRMALLARGARRPRSAIRGLLMAFQPLELGWAGKGEVLTLMKAEWQGGQPLLAGPALFCGYYLNELLMHLLPLPPTFSSGYEESAAFVWLGMSISGIMVMYLSDAYFTMPAYSSWVKKPPPSVSVPADAGATPVRG